MKRSERNGHVPHERPRITQAADESGGDHEEGGREEIRHLYASTVQVVTYRYLWEPWLPFGHLTLIEGDEGVGKSLFLARVVADATGGPRIDGGRRRRPGRSVVYLAGEESLAGSVVPRLRAAGADLAKVSFGPRQGEAGRGWRPDLPRDLGVLSRVVGHLRPAALVLEPVVSFFGRDHDWRRDQDAHAVLDPLVLMAADVGFAVLGARHWTKAASGPALARGMGSRAVSGCASVVIQLGRQDSGKADYAMVCPKNRLGPPIDARSYRITPVEGGAILRIGPPLGLKYEELQRSTTLGGAQKMLAARLLLRNKLAAGWLASAEIVSAAKKEGISDTVLYEAKALDHVRHRWNTSQEPKRSEWAAPKAGWPPLDGPV